MKFKLILMQFCVTAGLVTVACLLFIEAPPRIAKLFSKHKPVRCENISILNTTFIYGSCPDNTYTRDPGSDYPSMLATTSCTDSAGFRIDCKHGQKIFNRSNYHTFLIGDSFIQAEELDYSNSVYGLINNSTSPMRKLWFGFLMEHTTILKQSSDPRNALIRHLLICQHNTSYSARHMEKSIPNPQNPNRPQTVFI